MSTHVEHVGFAVSDLQKTVDFYKKLGFVHQFTLYDGTGKLRFEYLKDDGDGFMLELIPLGFQYDPGTKVRHMGFAVESIKDAAEELSQEGITLYNDREETVRFDDLGSKDFWVKDPDGNKIQFFEE